MQMITVASTLDWKGWLMGSIGALISGGAGAVSSVFGTIIVDSGDPDKYALSGGHLFHVAGICFAISGTLSLAKFLQTHPLPDANNSNAQ